MKRFFFSERNIPIALLLTCFLTYGLLIPWLGFYWDDWPYIWFAKTLGFAGFVDVFSHDRPFLAVLYSITLPLLGSKPIVWQFFALTWRWLASLGFWLVFRLLWPNKPHQAFWAALLFSVYPGFGQQWISVIYSEGFIILTAFLASLGLMLAVVRKIIPFWVATIGALILSAFNLFSTEYFFGLELLRPLILWFVISEMVVGWKPRIKRTFVQWLPYLLVLAGFTIWRVFFFKSANYQISAMESLSTTPQSTILGLLLALGSNFLTGGWLAWNQIFSPPNALDFQVLTTQLFWLVVIGTFISALIFLTNVNISNTNTDEEKQHPEKWGWQAVLIGSLALLAGGIPFWIANLPLTLVFPWNRFTLTLMSGSVLLLVGLLEIFIRTHKQKVILLSIFIALAAGWQFYNANTFRREWELSKDFFWQLSWRAPGIKPNTLLLTHEFPFRYYSDNSLTAPLNWMYAPDFKGRQMPYMLNYLSVRLKSSLPSAAPDQPVEQTYRALTFSGNTSNSLALYLSTNGCLKIMDPIYTNAESIPNLPYKMEPAIPISNLTLIDPSPEKPAIPAPQYLPEPAHTWCYYYQKAELARQVGNWEEAARLGEEALTLGYLPNTPTEWPVLIEAFGHVKNWERASKLTEDAYATNPLLRPSLCAVWDRVSLSPQSDDDKGKIKYIKSFIRCGQPIETGN
ncbi:MAG TPA: hypothetical protein VF338_09235 [Leptolinea sp.]